MGGETKSHWKEFCIQKWEEFVALSFVIYHNFFLVEATVATDPRGKIQQHLIASL